MSISIVIRARNEEDHIGKLLFGIMRQTVKDPEIILVDSGSTDGTLSVAAQFPVKIVHIHPKDFTFGRSLNHGITAASGEFVVIISAHCYPVYPDWLEQLTNPLKDDNYALSYGKQRGGESNHFSEHQIFHKYFPENSVLKQGHPYSHNANAAIKKSLWEQHPYNENLTGLEDLAWSSWAMEAGYSIAYIAEAEVIHLHEETYKQVHNRYMREAIAMKQILPNSSFSFWDFLKTWNMSIIRDMMYARRSRTLKKNIGSIFMFRLMQYLGSFKGYRFSGKVDAQLHRKFYYPPNILDVKLPEQRPVKPIFYDEDK
jgi:glycosyltransferase involved in cell wall biosynthesis